MITRECTHRHVMMMLSPLSATYNHDMLVPPLSLGILAFQCDTSLWTTPHSGVVYNFGRLCLSVCLLDDNF